MMATADVGLAVTERLQPLERQWRDLTLLRGLGSVFSGVGGLLLILLLVDLFGNLSPGLRAGGLLAVVAVGAWLLVMRLIRPLWRGIDLTELACWLEQTDPRWQERLQTCLELDASDAPTSRTSRLMQRQIRRETLALLFQSNQAEVLPPERAYRTLGAGLLLTALTLAPFIIWLGGYGLSWQRLAAPFGNWGWGRNYSIAAVVTPTVVARGAEAVLRADVQMFRGNLARPEQLTLLWRGVGAKEWDERRIPWSEADGQFVVTLSRVTADTEYRILGPASESPRYHLRVVDPPRLISFHLAQDAPAYTGQPSRQGPVEREVRSYLGSRLVWTATFDRPVSEVEFVPISTTPAEPARANADVAIDEVQPFQIAPPAAPARTTAPARANVASRAATTAELRSVAARSSEFLIRWRSPEGFMAEEPPRRFVVVPDQPPFVRIDGPTNVLVPPDERHRLQISAGDDYGLTVSELVAEVAPGQTRVMPLPRRPADGREFQWPYTVDLAALGVQSGQAVSLRARVVDNCEVPGPQERWSEPVLLIVNASAPSSATRGLAGQTDAARQELQELMRQVAQQRRDLRELHQKTAAATVRQKDSQQAERLEQLHQRQQELAAALQEWQQDLPQNGPWQQVAEMAEQLQQQELARIEAGLQTAEAAEVREAIEAMSKALDELAAAQRKLQDIDDQIRAIGNLGDELDQLARLANRAERMAESVAPNPAENANNANDPNAATPQAADRSDPAKDLNAEELAATIAALEALTQDLAALLADEPQLQAAMDDFRRQQQAATAPDVASLAEQQQRIADAFQNAAAAMDNAATQSADATTPQNGSESMPSPFQQGQQLPDQAQALAAALDRFAEAVAELNARADATANAAAGEAPPAMAQAGQSEPGQSEPGAAPAGATAADATPAGEMPAGVAQPSTAQADAAQAAAAALQEVQRAIEQGDFAQAQTAADQAAAQLAMAAPDGAAEQGGTAEPDGAAAAEVPGAAGEPNPTAGEGAPAAGMPMNEPGAAATPMGTPAASDALATETAPGPSPAGSEAAAPGQPGAEGPPAPTQPAAAEPGQPGATQPDGSQPGESQPGASQPGASQPGETSTNGAAPAAATPPAPSLAEQRQALAQQVAELQQALAAAQSNQETQNGALAAAQSQLAERAQQLAAQMPDGPANGSPPAPAAAMPVEAGASAAGPRAELQQAGEAMQQASQTLQQGSAQTAAEQSAAAAQALQQMAQRLQQAAAANDAGLLPAEAGAALSEAIAQLAEAGQRLQPSAPATPAAQEPSSAGAPPNPGTPSSPAESNPAGESGMPSQGAAGDGQGQSDQRSELANNFRQTADALRRAAESATGQTPMLARQRPQSESQPAGPPSEGGADPNDVAQASAPGSLAAAGTQLEPGAARNWGRLTSALQSELIDGGRTPQHPEYREQIRRYFQTLAEKAAQSEPTP